MYHEGIGLTTPQNKWNEYDQALSSDEPTSTQVLQEMSKVPAGAGTFPALDITGDKAYSADQKMNKPETKQENDQQTDAYSFEKNVQFIGG